MFVYGQPGPENPEKYEIVLPTPENMNRGKSFVWFTHALTRFEDADYIFKMDADVGFCAPALQNLLLNIANGH